ncbi:MAG TPA: 5,10-methylenetetrahydrofolate reductase [Arthrobacter bacterium]|jgi:methylenetetrahydrofolate reductase (NADPH)|nr:5,10-methylenetetrahydrofolate reductase [Arthrobacter sp.]HAP91363.1 5,10-methylenetetrahydrofolate reductase [Arthrobacter sp.]HCB58234.1 5,10-methylenetetrahydrofolate reductase [Arthrobacter sp.]HCC38851.1 5,10-methylenetetrahydrofolate reductase [Arthrobacter sp.]HCN23663.1 5,10-methylenetetrahydrofolate reductase [Arthrobacter sp.]
MSPPSLIETHPNLAETAPVALSYELFPPRSPAAAESLWTTIRELETTEPDYVSVTYGASGSNRDTAVELINRLLLETTLRPLAHLTCVGNTPEELAEIIGDLLDTGVRGILALRGDRPKDGAPPVAGSLHYAQDLIELIRRVEQRRSALLCAGKIAVGVAAYPTRHPESPSEAHDVEVLLAKQRSGADFAITQVFFHTEQYANLISRARRAGVTIPIIPGVMPLTSLRRVTRLGELTGVEPAPELLARLAAADSDAERLRIGVKATVDLAKAALDAGAPGIHLYTFNEHQSALEVLDKLALPRHSRSVGRRSAALRRQLAS